LIALDHRPWSRISYLKTCHSRQSPAATDNWSLGGTLRRTTGQLLAILGDLVARQVVCFRRGQVHIPGKLVAILCWPMEGGMSIAGAGEVLIESVHRMICPRGKVRLGSQRVCGWPERITPTIHASHGTMRWAFLHPRKVNVRSSLHHESARRNNLRLHAYT